MFPQAIMFPLVAMHKGSQNSLVCKSSSNTGINKTKLRFTLEGWVYGKRLKRSSIKAKNISFNFSNTYFRFPTGVKECSSWFCGSQKYLIWNWGPPRLTIGVYSQKKSIIFCSIKNYCLLQWKWFLKKSNKLSHVKSWKCYLYSNSFRCHISS